MTKMGWAKAVLQIIKVMIKGMYSKRNTQLKLTSEITVLLISENKTQHNLHSLKFKKLYSTDYRGKFP